MRPSHDTGPTSARGSIRPATCAVAVALSFALALSCSDPTAPGPLAGYQFLMLSHPEGASTDIYRTAPGGTARERFTADAQLYASMSLSPDGKRFAFISGCWFVMTMNVDGTDVRRLNTHLERCNRVPRWSPDGRYISFMSTRDGGYGIWVMNADGTNPHKVASPTQAGDLIYTWGWSPDGRVVFMDRVGSLLSTFTVNPDGTDRRRILGMEGDNSPRWSPDGSKVAFIRETADTSLHVMNADGSDVRRLTNHDGYDALYGDYLVENDHSYWSADGSQLVFYRFPPGISSQLHVIRVDGTDLVNLSPGGIEQRASFNGWSPDGRITLHRGGPSGPTDIFVVNRDGTGPVNLTSSPTWDSDALWLPR